MWSSLLQYRRRGADSLSGLDRGTRLKTRMQRDVMRDFRGNCMLPRVRWTKICLHRAMVAVLSLKGLTKSLKLSSQPPLISHLSLTLMVSAQ